MVDTSIVMKGFSRVTAVMGFWGCGDRRETRGRGFGVCWDRRVGSILDEVE
jgi:hypothetical protein